MIGPTLRSLALIVALGCGAGSALAHAPVIDYATVVALAAHGDSCAAALLAHSLDIWTAMLVNLIHAFDPIRVVVGGGIMAGADDFFEELTGMVLSRAHTPWGRVEIVKAELGDDAALVGCGVLATAVARGEI